MKYLLIFIIILTTKHTLLLSQIIDIQGQLKLSQTNINTTSDSILVKQNNGTIGVRNINTLPIIPNSSVLISELEYDTNFIEAGYINTGYFVLDKHTRGNDTTKYGEWLNTSLINSPIPRSAHSSVWTGSKMIIWGGDTYSGLNNLNTGGIYDPIYNTWTSTSLTNTPSARSYHTAIWTGNEMIVWGGNTNTGTTNTGGIYNPVSNSWTTLDINNAPSLRFNYVSIWTGDKLIIWGGEGQSSLLNSGSVYDPLTNTWVLMSTNNAPEPRKDFTFLWTGSELIIWGGRNNNNIKFNNGSKFNPLTNQWTSISLTNVPEARYDHTAVWTGNEMIIWGGRNINNNYLNTGSKYNPVTNTWITIGNSSLEARANHYSFWNNNEMIIWGGQGFDIQGQEYTNGAKYNPINDSWIQMNESNLNKSFYNVAFQAGNDIIFWSDFSSEVINIGAKYNTLTNQWTPISNKNEPIVREIFQYVWTGNKMIIWGGFSNTSGGVTNTGGVYDPSITGYSPSKPTLYYIYQKI